MTFGIVIERFRDADRGRFMFSNEPIAAPRVGDLDIMTSDLHSLGGRLSCTLTDPVKLLDLDISLDCDDGLESPENGVRER